MLLEYRLALPKCRLVTSHCRTPGSFFSAVRRHLIGFAPRPPNSATRLVVQLVPLGTNSRVLLSPGGIEVSSGVNPSQASLCLTIA